MKPLVEVGESVLAKLGFREPEMILPFVEVTIYYDYIHTDRDNRRVVYNGVTRATVRKETSDEEVRDAVIKEYAPGHEGFRITEMHRWGSPFLVEA